MSSSGTTQRTNSTLFPPHDSNKRKRVQDNRLIVLVGWTFIISWAFSPLIYFKHIGTLKPQCVPFMVQKQTNGTLKLKQQQLSSPRAFNHWVSLLRHRGHERFRRITPIRLAAPLLITGHTSRAQKRGIILHLIKAFGGENKDFWIDKLTSRYPSPREGQERKKSNFFCWLNGISSSLLNSWVSIIKPLFCELVPWPLNHYPLFLFFFFFPTQKGFCRCCAPRLTPDNSSRKVITVKHSQAAPFYSN